MNVVAECWAGIFQGRHPGIAAFKSVFSPSAEKVWDAAFAACQRVNAPMPEVELQGVAKLQRQQPVVLPPGSEMIVWAYVQQATNQPKSAVLVEDLDHQGQEWCVARSLSWVQGGKVPLRVCNPNPFPLELPQQCPLASVTQINPVDIKGRSRLVLRNIEPQVVKVDVMHVEQMQTVGHH